LIYALPWIVILYEVLIHVDLICVCDDDRISGKF
jgi:hypothetical protein